MQRHDRGFTTYCPLLATMLLAMFVAGACQPITAEKATLPWRSEMDNSADAMDGLSETEAALAVRAGEELADSLGVEPDSVTLVSMEAVDWPDASLGCPEPDMMYAAMITPGYMITFSVDETLYEVHTTADPDGPLVQCEG